jgi:hypothetical protein
MPGWGSALGDHFATRAPYGCHMSRILRVALAAGVVAWSLAGCWSLTEDRHFGVSRGSGGEVLVWFVNCYASPTMVSVYRANARPEADPEWQVRQGSVERAPYPSGSPIGHAPRGFTEAFPLHGPLQPDVEYKLSFGSGEAYYEAITFRPADLDTSILTFAGEEMSREEFEAQGCED